MALLSNLRNVVIALAAVGSLCLATGAQAQDYSNSFGPRISLKNKHSGQYAMAWGGGQGNVLATSANPWDWEEFEVWDANGGRLEHGDWIGLKTKVSRHFLGDDGGARPVTARSTWAWAWELFQIVRIKGAGEVRSGDEVGLRGHHEQFLGGHFDRGGVVGCWFNWLGTWETWTWIDRHDSPENRVNCVSYAKARVPSLPSGLFNLQDKISRCNVRDINAGRPADVAVIDSGIVAGHVAVVEQRHSDGTLTIREGNVPSGTIRSRRGTPAALKIKGFFRP